MAKGYCIIKKKNKNKISSTIKIIILIWRHLIICLISFIISKIVSFFTLYLISFSNNSSCVLNKFSILEVDIVKDLKKYSKTKLTKVETILIVKLFTIVNNSLYTPL